MNKKNRVRAAIALAIGTALLFPVASSAQDFGTLIREAGEDLDRQARISLRGLRRVVPPRTGALATGEKVEQPFSLKAGVEYGFLAIGDEDALDVDLQVLDSSGGQVPVLDRRGRPVKPARFVEDTRSDQVAFVRFRPRTAGRYVVRTIMFNCEAPAPTCEYALGTYRVPSRR